MDQPIDVPADVAADVVAQRELRELVRLGLTVATHHVADEALHSECLAVSRRGRQDLVRDTQALLVLARLVQPHDLAKELVAFGHLRSALPCHRFIVEGWGLVAGFP